MSSSRSMLSYAKEALKMANGVPDTAKALLSQIANKKGNEPLRQHIHKLGCDQMIRSLLTAMRSGAVNHMAPEDEELNATPSLSVREVGQAIAASGPALSQFEKRSFSMTYYLHGGVPLAWATKSDVKRSIDGRSIQVQGHRQCISFEQTVLKRLSKDSDTVASAWADDELHKAAQKCGLAKSHDRSGVMLEAAE